MPDPPGRTALVLGATGLVGGHLLRALATDARWGRVVTLGRRPMATAGPGHEDHVVDFARLGEQAALFACDDLFCALGTTIKKAGSPEAFRRVDVEIPFEAAQLARSAGAEQVLLVTSLGADPGSRLLYPRSKGEVERAVAEVGFPAVQVFRPSLLAGDRDEVRWAERIALALARPLGPLLAGPLAAARPTEARDVARAMVAVAARRPRGVHVYDPSAIREAAGDYRAR